MCIFCSKKQSHIANKWKRRTHYKYLIYLVIKYNIYIYMCVNYKYMNMKIKWENKYVEKTTQPKSEKGLKDPGLNAV